MAELLLHAPDTPIDRLHESLQRDGYVVIEEAATTLTNQAMHELHAAIHAAPLGNNPFNGPRTRRLGGLLRRSSAVRDITIHPLVIGFLDRVLQPYCARYQLNFSGIMHLLPGAGAQVLHRDGDLYPFPFPAPPTQVATMWALSEFTADNGATVVVPGSHLWEEHRKPYADEVVAAAMPAGSLLVYLSSTLHGGGENVSDGERTGLALQYSLGWLRQEENQYLANPPEIASTYPEALQRLIGYDYGGPYLGFVNGGNALHVLTPGYDGPRERSDAETDALSARMIREAWGTIRPVPTPMRDGDPVHSSTGPIGLNA